MPQKVLMVIVLLAVIVTLAANCLRYGATLNSTSDRQPYLSARETEALRMDPLPGQ